MDHEYLRLWQIGAPDLAAIFAVFAAIALDYGWLRDNTPGERAWVIPTVCAFGLIAALIGVLFEGSYGFTQNLFILNGQIVLTQYTLLLKGTILILGIIAILVSNKSDTGKHVSEYYALITLSTLGLGFLVTATNLLAIFVALELSSLSLYALVAFRKTSRAAAESALKYFTLGGVSSAFLLFGFSYLYGATNLINLEHSANAFSALILPSPLLTAALLFILVGIGFKVAAAPFHFWAPEVYRHAPTPVAGWIATGSKLATFAILVRFLVPTLEYLPIKADWIPCVLALAALSLLVGSLGALRQSNLKELLAYSGVAHTGYALVGVASGTEAGMSSAIFYMIVYAAGTLGAFLIVIWMENETGRAIELSDLSGFSRQSRLAAVCFFIFILSLAGIPPFGGFLAKYDVFLAFFQSHSAFNHFPHANRYVIGFALAMSTVGLYYYLKILKNFAALEPAHDTEVKPFAGAIAWCSTILAAAVLALGLFPDSLLELIKASILVP